MVASNQIRPVEQLLDRASDLRLRAPELALVLGERAASLAEAARSDQAWLRAESLVVYARVRLGDRAPVTARAVAALRSAEHLGYSLLSARLRTDLAVCARSVGMPLTGLALLRPVLAEPELTPGERATALCHLVGCMAQLGRKQELDRVLLEADRLCLSDESSDGDSRLVMRSLVRVGMSGHRRRHGDLTGAADAARTGLGFIEQLRDPSADGGLARARLVLQLVCTLLDRGNIEMALELAEPVLESPPRAGVIGPASWLRLAVATRVHLSTGAPEAAGLLLREAVYDADRHGLHSLTAKLLLELAHVEERLGRPADALECLRRSRAAEQVHLRMRRQACAVLSGEFGGGEQAPVDLTDVLARSPRTSGGMETTVIPRITDSTPPPAQLVQVREVARPQPQREAAARAKQPVRVEAPQFAPEELTQIDLPRYEPQREAARYEQPRQEPARYEQRPPESAKYEQPAAEAARYAQPAAEAPRYAQSATDAAQYAQPDAARYAQPAAEAPQYAPPAADAAQYAQAAGEAPRYAPPAAEAAHYAQAGEASRYAQPGAETPRYAQPAAEAPQYTQAAAEAPQYAQPAADAARYAQPAAEQVRYAQPSAESSRYGQPAAEYAPPAGEASRYAQAESGQYAQSAAEVSRYAQPAAEAPRYAPAAEAAQYAPAAESAQYAQSAGEAPRYAQAAAEASQYAQPAAEAAQYGQSAGEASRYAQPAGEAARYAQAEAAQYAQPAAEAPRYVQPAAEAPQYAQASAEAPQYAQSSEAARYAQTAEAGQYGQQPSGGRYEAAAEPPRYRQVAPEPLLAPPPAAEPEERLPAMTNVSQPEAAPRREERREEPHITTRHDAEHGSVAARSVLDRLGVSASGSGGGRRRAGDKPVEQPPAEAAAAAPRTEPVATPEPEKPAQEEGWLPKLRLPPSLAPVDEYTSEYGKTNYDLTNGDYTPPAPPADFVIPAEDPPPDAGLAELLALALAEHRAGTSSAAALVKRLGTQSDDEAAQPVNGSSRRGEYDHGRRQAGGEA
ncbi:hypothetical protein [Amycolatopsis sp. YIM 10]|uniref:hypothetical protein n=1 Tax=Amycolatopsis sp. YIM 10 TaxID=2653857 RepID=UPI0012900D9A|nr:hypothetical protein [Amycolatopsis sp. YIM 10]QFU92975.1 hypothetical protein YIM_39110 [Amycolatopsis sp. YIM 10]